MLVTRFYSLFFLPFIQCLLIEVTLTDTNDPKEIKLICGNSKEIADELMTYKYSVLWKGSKFGDEERRKLAGFRMTAVPNISVNSKKFHHCYLLAKRPFNNFSSNKKRILRDSKLESIPTEDGICPPGYRISQNRCFECAPGSYTSGQSYECFPCPKDFFMPRRAADSCLPCPDGRKTIAQGAGSEEDCVYFGENGQPIVQDSTPWVLILSLGSVILVILWFIALMILLTLLKKPGKDKASKMESGDDTESEKRPLQPTSDEHLYESISDHGSSDSGEHLYAEIGDFDDLYEEPLKPTHEQTYVEIIGSEERPRRRKRPLPSIPHKSQSLDSGMNLIPKRKSTKSSSYEVPIKGNTALGTIKEEYTRDSEHLYDDVYMEDENDEGRSRSVGFKYAVPTSEVAVRKSPESNAIDTAPSIDESKETDAGTLRQPRSKLKKDKSGESSKEAENNPADDRYDPYHERPIPRTVRVLKEEMLRKISDT